MLAASEEFRWEKKELPFFALSLYRKSGDSWKTNILISPRERIMIDEIIQEE